MPTKTTNISGFPEYLPAEQLAFNSIIAKITTVYESFGFVPLETAAVERIETLNSKGIDSKEVYALRRLNAQAEDGDKDIALRFDLTVPLARYVTQNYAELTFPFRRYQVQPVFRGERPQKGRYRQFHQFDIDTIADGAGALPLTADAEIIAAAHQALTAILPAGTKFTMRVNNRKTLLALLDVCGFDTDEGKRQAIKIIDDIEKIPHGEFLDRLLQLNAQAQIEELDYSLRHKDMHPSVGSRTDVADFKDSVDEVIKVITLARSLLGPNGNPESIIWDRTIARGLDYYTGTVVETRLEAAPELGSICSGGRYENLTESLSSRKLPGVGISIGISRLATWLMEQTAYQNLPATTAKLIVTGSNAAAICQQLRAAGIACELALGDKSPGQHFQTAQKRGIAYGIVADDTLSLRTFATREQTALEQNTLIPYLQTIL